MEIMIWRRGEKQDAILPVYVDAREGEKNFRDLKAFAHFLCDGKVEEK